MPSSPPTARVDVTADAHAVTPPRIMLVDPSGRGGLVSYTGLIARSLGAAGAEVSIVGSRLLDPADYDCRFLPRMPNLLFGSDQPHGLRLYAHRASQWLGGAAAVLRSTRELRPDVVHFQHAMNRRLDHRLLRRLARRAALVWTAHDVLPHERTSADEARFARIYRSVDTVIVMSEPAAVAIRELCQVEAVVVDHPVDDSIGRIERAKARDALGLDADTRILGALGFVRSYKGYDLLAETWQSLGENAPSLLVMGEVHSSAERAIVERLAASPTVDLRSGFASERDLHCAVAACDALLLPYSAGSDSGVLHLARALRTPVIASDAPQLAASVEASRSGHVVPRTVEAWAAAVTGSLPPAPPEPPSTAETGHAHLAAYETARGRAQSRKTGARRQLALGQAA